jgi:hypothetical protein
MSIYRLFLVNILKAILLGVLMEHAADANTWRFNVSWCANEPFQQERPNCPHDFYNFWKKKRKKKYHYQATERAGPTSLQASIREVFGSNL